MTALSPTDRALLAAAEERDAEWHHPAPPPPDATPYWWCAADRRHLLRIIRALEAAHLNSDLDSMATEIARDWNGRTECRYCGWAADRCQRCGHPMPPQPPDCEACGRLATDPT